MIQHDDDTHRWRILRNEAVRKSAVWSKFKQIVGDALTAAAAAISGASIPFRRYFRTQRFIHFN
jgi:hypothetical protein